MAFFAGRHCEYFLSLVWDFSIFLDFIKSWWMTSYCEIYILLLNRSCYYNCKINLLPSS